MWKEVVKGDITQHVYDAECATLTPPELPENFTDKKLGGVIENPHAQTEYKKGCSLTFIPVKINTLSISYTAIQVKVGQPIKCFAI